MENGFNADATAVGAPPELSKPESSLKFRGGNEEGKRSVAFFTHKGFFYHCAQSTPPGEIDSFSIVSTVI